MSGKALPHPEPGGGPRVVVRRVDVQEGAFISHYEIAGCRGMRPHDRLRAGLRVGGPQRIEERSIDDNRMSVQRALYRPHDRGAGQAYCLSTARTVVAETKGASTRVSIMALTPG